MNTKIYTTISILLPLGFLGACTPVVPPELAEARHVYQQATMDQTPQVAPAELHKAAEALQLANQSFADDPKSQRTRDLAYIAERKTELAQAIGMGELARRQRNGAEQAYTRTQSQIIGQMRGDVQRTKAELAQAERDRALDAQQLGSERAARAEAERKAAEADQRAKAAQESLAKLALVKEDERGMVITLSGSVLFASNKAELLPEAQTRLDQVAQALLATKERKIVVQGYTDSRGSDSYNNELSRRRAEAVRSYIVSKGYDSDLVSYEGLGKQRPIADNSTAEGRANNRRVEIVVQPKSKND